MNVKAVTGLLVAVFVLGAGAWQLSYVWAGGDRGVQPSRLVYNASIEPVADGPPVFRPDSAGAFHLSIRAGLDPGTYSGELVTQPGELPAACVCPDDNGSCVCIVKPVELNTVFR